MTKQSQNTVFDSKIWALHDNRIICPGYIVEQRTREDPKNRFILADFVDPYLVCHATRQSFRPDTHIITFSKSRPPKPYQLNIMFVRPFSNPAPPKHFPITRQRPADNKAHLSLKLFEFVLSLFLRPSQLPPVDSGLQVICFVDTLFGKVALCAKGWI